MSRRGELNATNVRRVPGLSFFGFFGDAAALLLVVLALPLGILLIGAPLAYLIKLALALANRFFG